jgi:hypothetical protein
MKWTLEHETIVAAAIARCDGFDFALLDRFQQANYRRRAIAALTATYGAEVIPLTERRPA